MGASSRQVPLRLMGCVISAAAGASRQGSQACWMPLSVWQISPGTRDAGRGTRGAGRGTRGAGRGRPIAMACPGPRSGVERLERDPGRRGRAGSRASPGRAILRVWGSRIAARWSEPSPVRTQSPPPRRPGSDRPAGPRIRPGSGPGQALVGRRRREGAPDPVGRDRVPVPAVGGARPQQPPAAATRSRPGRPRRPARRGGQGRAAPHEPAAPRTCPRSRRGTRADGAEQGSIGPGPCALALVPWPLCPGPCAPGARSPGARARRQTRRARGT